MHRKLLAAVSALAAGLAAAACQTTAAQEPVSAVLIESSPAVTESLSAAVSEALGGVKVTLAPGELTKSSTLVLETKIPQSMDRNRTAGMMNDRARPEADSFELMKEGRKCYLVHANTGNKIPLSGIKCQAL